MVMVPTKDHRATPMFGEPTRSLASQYRTTSTKFQYNYEMGDRHELTFSDRAEVNHRAGSVGGVGCQSGLRRYYWDDRMLQ